MRINCPINGERDSREFSYMGDAPGLEPPRSRRGRSGLG